MKKLIDKIKVGLFVVCLAGAASSCNKIQDFGDTNTNPNDITDLKTYAVLTGVETGISGWANSRTGQLYCQYLAEAQYPGVGLYSIPKNDIAGTYSGQLLNLNTIIKANQSPDEVAIATILTQYIYWNLTDTWGDIPYSEALSGVVPAYDKQEDIYKGMIAKLKSANAMFTGAFVRGDILNNSNTDQWKKFANSLRMVMALNLSKRFPASTDYAAIQFRDALTDGGIATNADNVMLSYPGGNFKNPFFLSYESARDDGESNTLYNLLATLGDARHTAWGTSSTPVPFGLKAATLDPWIKANPGWSHIMSASNRTETSPVYVLTAASTYLARAEARDRGWTGPAIAGGSPIVLAEDAVTLLKQGVDASFQQWNLPAPAASYYTQSNVVLSAPQGTGANIKPIAIQRYLAFFPDGRQGWSIYRKTGWPALTGAPDPLDPAHSTIPRRWVFAQNEYDLNPVGVAAGVARLVPATDVQESRIWWDQ